MTTRTGSPKAVPHSSLVAMKPSTRRMLQRIGRANGNPVILRLPTAREAKNAQDALRSARRRGHVRYKLAVRQGRVLTVRVR